MKRTLLVLLAWPLAVMAQSESQLIERYTALAGSKQNATSLVNGLRDGKEVKLTKGTTTETFTPPTGKMGYGNVDNALALATASLEKKGITQPTPAQLEASVMEVLKLRADGKGWGQIAQARGVKLGDVKRAEKPQRVAKVERPNKPEKPQKPERPQRPERPEKPEKPR
jgi:hypothetical protein